MARRPITLGGNSRRIIVHLDERDCLEKKPCQRCDRDVASRAVDRCDLLSCLQHQNKLVRRVTRNRKQPLISHRSSPSPARLAEAPGDRIRSRSAALEDLRLRGSTRTTRQPRSVHTSTYALCEPHVDTRGCVAAARPSCDRRLSRVASMDRSPRTAAGQQ